jgi:hypothetical protein
MSEWIADDLARIGEADELQIVPLPRGARQAPVTIWVVRVGNDLYVRSYRGPDGSWFRNARASRRGHILAGGVSKNVTFAEARDSALNDQIDSAYRTKYGRYSPAYVGPMVAAEVRATTIRLVPDDQRR